MTDSQQQFNATLTYPFEFTNLNSDITETLTVPVTVTVQTNSTIFPYTFTQTFDPYYQGRGSTFTTNVTLSTEGSQSIAPSTPATTTAINSSQKATTSSSTLTSSASTSSSVSPVISPSPGVSNGTAAGIGVGCAVAGAAIAAVLVVFLMRRRQRRHSTRSISRGPSVRPDLYGSSGGTMMSSMAKSGPTATVERALEPPMQDSDILSSMQRLGTAIKNHAQSYYGPVGGGLSGESSVSEERLATLLGLHAPMQTRELALLLTSPQCRTAAIRFLIAWTVLRDTKDGPETSLLPPELAKSLEIITPRGSNTHERPLMLSRWRQMTGTLMRETYDTDVISPSDGRQRNIREVVDGLNAVLAPLASCSRGSDVDRLENLEELVKRGARFEYMLFTQPTEWDFSWAAPGRQRSDLVVFPGLLRTADEKGTRLAQPHPQGAAQVISIGPRHA